MSFNPGACTFETIQALNEKRGLWLQAATVAYIGYGIVLALFLMCLYLILHKIEIPRHMRRAGLKAVLKGNTRTLAMVTYVLGMTTLSTLSIASTTQTTRRTFIDTGCWDGVTTARTPIVLNKMGNYSYVIANWGADGILVWRCWVIYRCSTRIPIWISLAMPVFLYLSTIGMGLYFMIPRSGHRYAANRQSSEVIYACLTLSLNLLTTSMIVIRLLVYRCRLTKVLGKGQGRHYTSLSAILIESAVLVVVFNAFLVATMRSNSLVQYVAFEGNIQAQIIAPLLIIFRVLQGKAWSSDAVTTPIDFLPRLESTVEEPSDLSSPPDHNQQRSFSTMRFSSHGTASATTDDIDDHSFVHGGGEVKAAKKKSGEITALEMKNMSNTPAV